MTFHINVSTLRMLNETDLSVPDDGVLVVVGPNGSGKSTFLRELSAGLVGEIQGGLLLEKVNISTSGSSGDAIEWFRTNVSNEMAVPGAEPYFRGHGSQLPVSRVADGWDRLTRDGSHLRELATFFVANQWAESRLELVTSAGPYNPLTDLPSHPMQQLYADAQLEAKVSGWTQRAFGFPVFVTRYGSSIELRVGKVAGEVPPPPPPLDYLREVASKRLVAGEGDGVRAFVGLMLNVLLIPRPITIIDEPEAFLHPPQARFLGELLVSSSPPGAQIVLATHSNDVLQGVISGVRNKTVKIVRLSKVDDRFEVGVVPAEDVMATWSDPLLRYSNLLDGLFHAGVVICEGDSDCRFYGAVLTAVQPETSDARDLFLTHVNGKARIAKAIERLRGFHVRTAAIVDFDVLNEQSTLQKIVTAAGGDWLEMRHDYDQVRQEVQGRGATVLTAEAFRSSLTEILRGVRGNQIMSDALSAKIEDLLKPRSAWHLAKEAGLAFLRPSRTAAQRLLDRLEALGIFVVPVGELESWLPMDVKKERYVVEALESGVYMKPTPALSGFLNRIAKYVANRDV